MIVLRVPLEVTLDYVAETLPSDSNLTIIISAAQLQTSTLVCLPRLITALEWLRINNPHYAKVYRGKIN